MPRVVFRLCGQLSGGPSGVRDQSLARISAPSSPPPCRNAEAFEARAATVAVPGAGLPGPAGSSAMLPPHLTASVVERTQSGL